MSMRLGDDGTLDTVIVCEDCGEEMRYNLGDDNEPRGEDASAAYDRFVEECIEDAEEQHECSASDEPTAPEEDDLTTEDHEHFYQSGKLVLEPARSNQNGSTWFGYERGQQFIIKAEDYKTALRAYMERSQYWPNIWVISDHGNAHLMDLGKD